MISPSGAQNVLRAIFDGVHLIGARPLAYPPTSDPSIRVKMLSRYRYKIFFEVKADAAEILHIRHMSRTPWI